MVLTNPFGYKSSFYVGRHLMISTENPEFDYGKMTVFLQNAVISKRIELLSSAWSSMEEFLSYSIDLLSFLYWILKFNLYECG